MQSENPAEFIVKFIRRCFLSFFMVIRMRRVMVVGVVMLMVAVLFSTFAGAGSIGRSIQPTIEILPDKILNPNEEVLVVGKNWTPNSTVRIDLILPSGTAIEGVTSAITDENGTFQATFTAPNQYGEGYIRAVQGDLVVSEQVFFNGGMQGYELDISWSPQPVYTNETIEFTVEADFLASKNYVLDVIVFHVNKEEIYYEVLHNGYAVVYLEFNEAGKYYITFKVEETVYNKTVEVDVFWNPNTGGGGGGGEEKANATWSVSVDKGVAKVMVMVNNELVNGVLTVISPSGSMAVYQVVGGIATFKLDEAGTYIFQFKDNATGTVFTYQYEYEPKVDFSVSDFVDGEAEIELKVDGEYYADMVTVEVETPSGKIDTVTLTDGKGSYEAEEEGSYTFTVELFGKQYSAIQTFTDTPKIENLVVYQSSDLDYLIVMGTVVGEVSGKPLYGRTVKVSSYDLSMAYGRTATTDEDGSFVIRIPLTAEDRGKTVSITVQVGSAKETATAMLNSKIEDSIGWIVLAVIFVFIALIVLLAKFGYIKMPRGAGVPRGVMFGYSRALKR